jgi:hypothetical protein
VFVSFI